MTSKAKWENRIVKHGEADPTSLEPNPQNWRMHPASQAHALEQVLDEVGTVQGVIVNKRTGRLVDGHLRVELAIKRKLKKIPVCYVDLSEEEEKLVLATLDPLAGMAGQDDDVLAGLLDDIRDGHEELLKKVGLASSGFAHEGAMRNKIKDWHTAESFFAMPDWLHEIWPTIKTIAIAYSGGLDSTAAAIWAAEHKGDRKCVLVFADPGVEFPGISAHIAHVAEYLGAEYKIVRAKDDWWIWLEEKGRWPSMLYRDCASRFVHAPVAKHIKTFTADETIVLTGSRAEEAVDGSTKTERSSLPSFGAARDLYQHYAPCFKLKKAVLNDVLQSSGVPIWPGYKQGFVRTACWCCMGQNGDQALALEENYPGLANVIRHWEHTLGPVRPDEDPPRYFDDVLRAGQKRAKKSLDAKKPKK